MFRKSHQKCENILIELDVLESKYTRISNHLHSNPADVQAYQSKLKVQMNISILKKRYAQHFARCKIAEIANNRTVIN